MNDEFQEKQAHQGIWPKYEMKKYLYWSNIFIEYTEIQTKINKIKKRQNIVSIAKIENC